MKKREWTLVISLVPAVWLLDQLTKAWAAASLRTFKFFGPLGLVLHHNPGAMLGTFSDLPPLLRIVSLSTGGAFLIFIYGAIQYLIPSRSLHLRVGMSLLLGGILGNVTDRILHGTVTDFIVLGTRALSTPAFNFADSIQWVGYILIVIGLIRDGSLFWPDSNTRKKIWINPSFQLKYCATMVAIGSCFALISGVFAYTFLKVTIQALVVGPSHLLEHRFLFPFLVTYGVISAAFMVTLFALGRILSHRTAGPIYAFEAYIRDLMRGRDRQFKVRKSDEFKSLEALAEDLRPLLIQKTGSPTILTAEIFSKK